MFCSQCGTFVSDDARFCPACGAPIEAVRATYASGAEAPRDNDSPVTQAAPSDFSYRSASAAMGGRYVDDDRSFVLWVILTIITCGIYNWYFVYCLARDLNIMCEHDGEETPGLATFILLSIVTCGIYSYWWYFKVGNRLQDNAPRYGLQFQENGTTILMWQILGLLIGVGPFVAMYILIKNTNALAARYNAARGM